ncbi:alkaline phosphatase [Bacillus coahuilensis]|uniref:alkaline phosphatase n=1 Tax=Bacillus coahuilensis TaxID=408580 RepID=UPI0009E6F552
MKKQWGKKVAPVVAASALALTSLISGSTDASAKKEVQLKGETGVKNMIMVIADGAGQPFYTAYRYMKDDPSTKDLEATVFDDYFVGMQTVYAHDHEENIPDSAATATAMASGIKTYNGAIGLDVHGNEVKTVLEQSKEEGLSTGLVATSRINHATPAAYVAKNKSRSNYNEIADDFYDNMINGEHAVDVILGGGEQYFKRADRDLTKEFQEDGYGYVTTRTELMKDSHDQLLGLFGKDLSKAIDRHEEEPTLVEMAKESIERLEKNEDGFYLMIEASQIDWAGHDNDVISAMSEMEEYAELFEYLVEYAKEDGETLVVATADHSTGGLSIGSGGPYLFHGEVFEAFKHTPDYIAGLIVGGADVEQTLKENIDLELTSEEIQSVKDAAATKDYYTIDDAIDAIGNERVRAGWTTDGHTGEEVPVFAYGPLSEHYEGLIDNTFHADMTFEILEQNKVNSMEAEVTTLAGSDRVATSLEVSHTLYPDGFPEDHGSKTAIVTTGSEFADALSAGPLAAMYDNAPILLNTGEKLNEEVKEELKRLGAEQVVILGGTKAVSKSVEDMMKKEYDVKRVSGADRFKTNEMINNELKDVNGVFVASGSSFADALAAAPIASANNWAIVLTGKDEITSDALDFVKGKKTVVLGGEAVISKDVYSQITKTGKDVKRIAGENRYETVAALNEVFKAAMISDTMIVTTGENFPDALAASALSVKTKAPMVLVGQSVNGKVKSFVESYSKENKVLDLWVVGGTTKQVVVDDLKNTLK